MVHSRGFAGASVRDIVQAAGVPQGSFTNHFASKEAFGLEVIELYRLRAHERIAETLLNESLAPLARLGAYLDMSEQGLCEGGIEKGCLFGNFAAEASAQSTVIRERLLDSFAEIRAAIATCLEAAARASEVPKDLDARETAAFILASLQGATLLAKAERSPAAIERFKKLLFSKILR